jgi:hypothetical protein
MWLRHALPREISNLMHTTMATSTEAPASIAAEAAVPAESKPKSNNAASPPPAAEEATVEVPTADANADTNPPTALPLHSVHLPRTDP